MFKIQNNKVYISRGQSAVYSREVVKGDTLRTPYIIGDIEDPHLVFTISTSIVDPKYIKRYIGAVGIKTFDSTDVITVDELPETDIENRVYHRVTENGRNLFSYFDFDEEEWLDYAFTIEIPILPSDTIKLEPKTYYYDIKIQSGTTAVPIFRDIILPPTEFIVEGVL